MPITETDTSSAAAKQAMQRVLEAEQEAELAIKECRQEARRILHAARDRVRHIKDRADERISLIHLHQQQSIEQKIRLIQQTTDETSGQQKAWDLSDRQLQYHINDLARQLISVDGIEQPLLKDGG
ncbi:MAG: hypothetical protein KZQ58_03965 [gamma proteobacterium symbiont of Bathyaustriella thionipta]|nr:hypothetical protein [gamma proteobacterium symbiont of Bathyaustriella thionipta]